MRSVSDMMARAQELVVAGGNSALPAPDRNVIAIELRTIADAIDQQSQLRSVTGQDLFATGSPLVIRFNQDSAFAPVPARADLFEIGGVAISQIVRDAADAITNGNTAQIGTLMTAINSGVSQFANAGATIGLNAARLDRINEAHASQSILVSSELSTLEDTDLSAAIAELNAQTVTLEAAQAAFARINRRTLMDFLN
jgi:flagellar hook-associated protein 3 FlgL